MAQVFELRKPVTTESPFVDVENKLAPGVHTFTLVVVDNDGNQSNLTRAVVTVRNPSVPPIITRPPITGPIVTGPIVTAPIITGPPPAAPKPPAARRRPKAKTKPKPKKK